MLQAKGCLRFDTRIILKEQAPSRLYVASLSAPGTNHVTAKSPTFPALITTSPLGCRPR